MNVQDLKILFEDADVNYHSGRLKDALKGFDYLFEQTKSNLHPSSSVYFAYRIMVIYEVLEKNTELIKYLKQFGLFCLQQSARICAYNIEREINPRKKIKVMEHLKDVLEILNEKNNLEKLIQMMIPVYERIIQEHDITILEKNSYLIKMVEILEPQTEKVREIYNLIGQNFQKYLDIIPNDKPREAKEKLIQSKKYYKLAGNSEMVAEVEQILLKMD